MDVVILVLFSSKLKKQYKIQLIWLNQIGFAMFWMQSFSFCEIIWTTLPNDQIRPQFANKQVWVEKCWLNPQKTFKFSSKIHPGNNIYGKKCIRTCFFWNFTLFLSLVAFQKAREKQKHLKTYQRQKKQYPKLHLYYQMGNIKK